ncbi:MAG: right-handed parallel beta-helix repeat-containing protein [Prevotella sp.]|nr:right-handed parallel beta-helix repeat-containing protein [Prevotella sp.]
MKKYLALVLFLTAAMAAQAQMEKAFKMPPAEMCSHVILGWEGEITPEVISRDLSEIQAKGFRNVIIEPGYHMGIEYLGPQWFANMRMMADSVERRGMRMWIIDEGKYPSGMAGGKFSKERPDLCMQALVADGDTVKAVRRSSQTRCVNNPTGGKDENNSLCDYLDTAAVAQFISWTHEEYRKTLGRHLGTTVLGFRGDEPAFQRVPWTGDILKVFKQEKGYDPTNWLNALLKSDRMSVHSDALSDTERRVKADFWDVWSRLFAERYFKAQADWCEAHGVQHITHMDKDDELPWCVKMEGDPFRCLSRVQVPGIDVIWSQIWYGSNTEFPRLASSIAHVYGRQRAFSESFAAYRRKLSTASVKYIVDYQLARGINFFEFMFWMSKRGASNYMAEPGMKALNDYVNRAGYLLSQGRPTARTAVYAPIPSLWMGDNKANDYMKAAAHMLAAHQYDFDFITDDGIIEATTPRNGSLVNRSGQAYTTLVIPAAEVVREGAWEKIQAFAARGGKVIYVGGTPKATFARTMTQTRPITPLDNTLLVADSIWTSDMEAYLPVRDMEVTAGRADSLVCCARQTEEAKIFFILNQRGEDETVTLDLDCMGEAQLWDAMTGETQKLPFKVVNCKTRVQLSFPAWGSRIIVVKKRTVAYEARRYKNIQAAIDRAHSEGGGTVVVGKGRHKTGALFFPRGVDLHLDRGATLVSIVDSTLYPLIDTRWEGRMRKARAALLNFDHNEGCRLTGEGTIDAQGLEWKKQRLSFAGRPKTICFDHCDGGAISGVSILNQAFWCLHILFTDGFTVDGININAEDYIPSSDGIDIDSSTGVTVRNAHIRAHDDCISIKSGRDADGRRVNKSSENILIENCHFDYGHGGVAIGSEVSGDVRNVTVRHCDMTGENWNPIRLKSQPSRGGVVENILFEDIDIAQARNVVEINMTWRMVGADEPPCSPRTSLRNIRLRNIKAHAKHGGIIHGFEEQPIPRGAVTFENCLLDTGSPIELKNADIDLDGVIFDKF